MLKLDDPISKNDFLDPKNQKKLENIGIKTIGDLLYYFPHRYDDFSVFKKISELLPNETVTIQGQITSIKTHRTWKKRMMLTECFLNDETGEVKIVWFNFMSPLKFISKGKYVQISGKTCLEKKTNTLFFQHPNLQFISKKQFLSEDSQNQTASVFSTGALIPVYSETRNLSSFYFRRIIQKTLPLVEFEEFIPKDILTSQKLLVRENALKQIHFPDDQEKADLSRKRFAFEKMFLVQIKSLLVKNKWDNQKAVSIPFDEKFIKKFVGGLPFSLTDAQKKSAWQIIQDLEKEKPMNRLMEGDVGSGKTIVAVMAILSVIKKGFQTALLAPTEVLAVQHYASIAKIIQKYNFSGALLTASNKKMCGEKTTAKKLLENISKGEIDYVIGTHALLQEKVKFKNLALIIIDEQHRFGVNQRAYLQQKTLHIGDGMKNKIPHLLTMTATPIPRTLSLAIFGNLDLSIIDEFPKGRKKIITKSVDDKERSAVYDFARKEIIKGRQIFVICPLVEESSKISQVKAVVEEKELLEKKIFSEFKIALLHGKMKAKEKDQVMEDFKMRKFDILVSTSVVEVGIDIPNATVIIIEGAERFGLSQLHQFRGRVGRSEHQSYCFLLTSPNIPHATARLKVMEKTNDGFEISKADLKLRGPGQFLGTTQSGMPDIAMQSLSDIKTIQACRLEAQRVTAFNPDLDKFPLLKKELGKIKNSIHWE